MPNFNNGTIGEIGYGQEKSVEHNAEPLISDGTDVTHFIELLGDMSDPRDNRGKRHELSFVLAVTAMAIMSGKNHVSEIHRYIREQDQMATKNFRSSECRTDLTCTIAPNFDYCGLGRA